MRESQCQLKRRLKRRAVWDAAKLPWGKPVKQRVRDAALLALAASGWLGGEVVEALREVKRLTMIRDGRAA